MFLNIIIFVILVIFLDIVFGKIYDKLLKLIDFWYFGPRVTMLDNGEVIYLNGPKKPRKALFTDKTKKYLKYFLYLAFLSILTMSLLAIFAHIFRLMVDVIITIM